MISVIFWLLGTVIVVLGPIILVHELGHFISAKLAGARVEEFGFGWPPRMLKLWRGKGYLEINDTRAIIPPRFKLPPELLVGADVDVVAAQQEDGAYTLRRLTMLDSDTDDVTSIHEITGEEVHMRGQVTAREPGTLYSLNWLPMGAFVRITGEEDPSDPLSLAARPKRWRIATMAAGPVLNIVAAFLLLVSAYLLGLPESWFVQVSRVEPGTAAEAAGIQAGDVVMAVDEKSISEGMRHLRDIIRSVPNQTVELTVWRGDETLTLEATPRLSDEGYGYLGILMSDWPDRSSVRPYPLHEAINTSIDDFRTIAVTIAELPGRLIEGDVTPQEVRPTSVVGASQILTFSLQQSIKWGVAFPVLQAASFISLALGLTNLLPLPALDGGRILFVLVEAVRGRRIPPEREALVHFIGLAILIGLTALIIIQDIINPILPWSLLER